MNDVQDLIKLTATVREVVPAPSANRSGKIKTTEGLILSAFSDKLQLIDIGGTYEFGCLETQKGNVIYRDIKTVKLMAPNRPRVEPEMRRPARSLSSAASAEPQRATSPNGNTAGQYYRPTSPRDSERMFVCSTLNAFISTGRVECHRQVIAEHINELRAAYAATFGQDDPA